MGKSLGGFRIVFIRMQYLNMGDMQSVRPSMLYCSSNKHKAMGVLGTIS